MCIVGQHFYILPIFVAVDCPSNVRYVYTSHVSSGIFHHQGGIALCLNLLRYRRYVCDPLICGAKLFRALDSAAFLFFLFMFGVHLYNGENYIMRSLVICTPYPILCGW
jgi:hypothetical protein